MANFDACLRISICYIFGATYKLTNIFTGLQKDFCCRHNNGHKQRRYTATQSHTFTQAIIHRLNIYQLIGFIVLSIISEHDMLFDLSPSSDLYMRVYDIFGGSDLSWPLWYVISMSAALTI